jgi:hypothetical protein
MDLIHNDHAKPSRLIRIGLLLVRPYYQLNSYLRWILCLNLNCKMKLVISGFTICFYVKLGHDSFEINDFIQNQSSIFAHFTITNYHLCRF